MGSIVLTAITNGMTGDATVVNNNFTTIASAINGGLSTVNLTAGGVDLTTIAAATAWTVHTSTLSGFSGTPIQINRYIIYGKTLLYTFDFVGTSNSTAITFTIPNNAKNATRYGGYFVTDNTIDQTVPGAIATGAGGSTISCYKDMTGSAWTNTGSKGIRGILICELA